MKEMIIILEAVFCFLIPMVLSVKDPMSGIIFVLGVIAYAIFGLKSQMEFWNRRT